MAKIKFGMMMTDARGKLGGQVFSKNRSGAYVRTKVTPVNPRTAFQQENRSLLGSISTAWSGLNADARRAWNNVVSEWQKTNVFGDLQKPSGKNLFTSLNKNRTSHYPSLPMLENPPAKVEFPAFVILSASFSQGTAAFTVTLDDRISVSQDFRIRATTSLSAGTSYITNQLRSLQGVFNASETGVITISSEYNDRFGRGVQGSIVGVEITPIDENGQLGVPAIYLVTVIA